MPEGMPQALRLREAPRGRRACGTSPHKRREEAGRTPLAVPERKAYLTAMRVACKTKRDAHRCGARELCRRQGAEQTAEAAFKHAGTRAEIRTADLAMVVRVDMGERLGGCHGFSSCTGASGEPTDLRVLS
jgi:hypothetical protein